MDQKLESIQKLVRDVIPATDIDDIVFDYNGQKPRYQKDCPGKILLDKYNSYVITENNYNRLNGGLNNSNKKEQIILNDTRCFWINGTRNYGGDISDSVISYYFKEFTIIETQRNTTHWISNPSTFISFRHYFRQDALLFLRYFHSSVSTSGGMEYRRQNPDYFTHNTVGSIKILEKIGEITREMIDEHKTKSVYYNQLEQKVIKLEKENQTLRNKIIEMEESAAERSLLESAERSLLESAAERSHSPIKLKIE
jgi:hypothetical protein